ncbi:MAG: hypothetical protein V8R63_10525 [Thomasclavelia ramosa]
MLRLNKFTKITSIYIITMMMITTIFTYFGYYAHKATIKDDWPTKYVADDINDDLKYNYSQFTDVVIANIDRNVTSVYLAFDEDFNHS